MAKRYIADKFEKTGGLPTQFLMADGSVSVANTFPAPFIDVVIPDSTLPSTTGNFELYGSFFKEDMTIAFTGQVVNYKIFHSSNWVTVNVTTGAAEGLFSITLDNGISRTFPNAYMVVLGTVFTPLTANFTNIVQPVTLEDSSVLVKVVGSQGSADWNINIDITKRFRIYVNLSKTPMGWSNIWQEPQLFSMIENISELKINFNATTAGSTYNRFKMTSTVGGGAYASGVIAANYSLIMIHWDLINMFIYIDGILKYTFPTFTYTQNFYLRFYSKYIDITKIKYVELA